MPLSFLEAYLGLCALFVLLLPVGLVLVRLGERWLGRTVHLSLVERILLAFYLAGGLLYVLASVPLPAFGTYLVVGVIGAGVLGAVLLRVGYRTPLFGKSPRADSVWEVGLLVLGTLSLLGFELFPVWQHPLPNAWDGSVATLWINLTVSNHTLPWTLQPYAAAGVTYPQGQTVWMALPVVLWGWSVVSVPILVPPLFLALSLPATYCWGRRLGGLHTRSGQVSGLLFAAFFALVASWPRFYAGGRYDFVMALPLFLVLLGWVREVVAPPSRPWSEVLLLGVGVGVLASLSLPVAEAFLVLLFGFAAFDHRSRLAELWGWLPRLFAVAGVVALFLVRSVVGTVVWFSYPAYVLSETGTTLQTPPGIWAPFGSMLLQQQLDPFVPWKGRLSPFPVVSLMLQILLVLAIVFAAGVALRAAPRFARLFPPRMLSTLLGTCGILFVLTSVLVTSQLPGPVFTLLGAVTNLDETSYLLFIGFSALAAVPLIAAAQFLSRNGSLPIGHEARPRARASPAGSASRRPRWTVRRDSPARAAGANVAVLLVLLVPLTLGAVLTTLDGSSVLEKGVDDWSHVSSGDLTVLGWASAHLPSCSAVYVAPGSVGQFLPEYANVHLVYQMTPSPQNHSYYLVYADLSSDAYSAATRLALSELGITEVFVSGATTSWYAAIDPTALENNSDFRELTQSGDASVFEFTGGSALSSCLPA